MDCQYTYRHHKRVKLIFNPSAGANRNTPSQLEDVIKELQAFNYVPEPYILGEDSDLPLAVEEALSDGISLIAVCGGDGTVSSAAGVVAGTNATLCIIPAGTQNNVALGLGIPPDIPAAIKIMRTGRRIKADMGKAVCGDVIVPFLEVCSVGLFSALFESGDDIQHGNIAKIGDFLTTLTSSPPSDISIMLDGKVEIKGSGHVVLVSNMPYVGRHYQIGRPDSFKDGLLDVVYCSDVPKLDLLVGYILKAPGMNSEDDSRIKHFNVRKVFIDTKPPMAVMADGKPIGEGSVSVEVQRNVLSLIAPDQSGIAEKTGEDDAR